MAEGSFPRRSRGTASPTSSPCAADTSRPSTMAASTTASASSTSRHEQTAGHAADGYARVTGKPGVCAVTAGPGVTDVVTAVANAQRAGIPMLVIGGAGPRILQDMGSLQDMNHVGPHAPHLQVGHRASPIHNRLPEYIDAAMRVAQASVPGPVFLEMPLDILMNWADDVPPSDAPPMPPRPAGDPTLIKPAPPMSSATPSGPCSSSAPSSAGARAADVRAPLRRRRPGADLRQRHGPRRHPRRPPEPLRPLAQAGHGRSRPLRRLRHPLRLPP